MKIEESSQKVAKQSKILETEEKKRYENSEFGYSRKSNSQEIGIPGRENRAIEVRTFSKK